MTNKRVQQISQPEQINHTLGLLKADSQIDIEFAFFSNERLKGRVVGSQPGKYFLLALPKAAFSGHENMLVEGQTVVIRAIIEGDTGACIAFKVQIQSVSLAPYYLLFLQYPKKLEMIHLRQQTRLSTLIPASLTLQQRGEEGHTQVLTGMIHDISTTGCRFKADNQTSMLNHLDRTVEIDISVDSQSVPLKLPAKITNSNGVRSGTLSLGIEFAQAQMAQENQQIIARIVQNRVLSQAS
ncbi:PilZ domain-containing protein [Shewanella waksmanii]|uniref:PilZ domain-containing protein n=1 Tax=Shewanella waksmanii TaxID=213783 RepID=UPI003736F5DC